MKFTRAPPTTRITVHAIGRRSRRRERSAAHHTPHRAGRPRPRAAREISREEVRRTRRAPSPERPYRYRVPHPPVSYIAKAVLHTVLVHQRSDPHPPPWYFTLQRTSRYRIHSRKMRVRVKPHLQSVQRARAKPRSAQRKECCRAKLARCRAKPARCRAKLARCHPPWTRRRRYQSQRSRRS